jgi:hydroxymethylpyrimidine/phosphomethylpyrimidine kinase
MVLSTNSLPKRVLALGGSDSGGSAGIQADLKTYEARGVFGLTALTAITAQDSTGVKGLHPLPEAFIRQQAEVVLADMGAHCIKTGFLARAEVVSLAAELIRQYAPPCGAVIDPVLMDGTGRVFVSEEALAAYRDELFPLARVITPNWDEAALLAGRALTSPQTIPGVAKRLAEMGPAYVLIKGGHWADSTEVFDWLYDRERGDLIELRAPRLAVQNPHGVGCTLASAIAAELAKGLGPVEAVKTAHQYLQAALAGSLAWDFGAGRKPVFHGVKLEGGGEITC